MEENNSLKLQNKNMWVIRNINEYMQTLNKYPNKMTVIYKFEDRSQTSHRKKYVHYSVTMIKL